MGAEIKITFPLPGSVFVIDPDVPSSRVIPLSIAGTESVNWQSDSLELFEEGGKIMARAAEGDHRITAIDPATGQTAETWIAVPSLWPMGIAKFQLPIEFSIFDRDRIKSKSAIRNWNLAMLKGPYQISM